MMKMQVKLPPTDSSGEASELSAGGSVTNLLWWRDQGHSDDALRQRSGGPKEATAEQGTMGHMDGRQEGSYVAKGVPKDVHLRHPKH